MAHFAVVAPPLPGHLNPMMALAHTLIARGHRVSVVHQPDVAALVRPRPGLVVRAVGADTHPPGTLARLFDHMNATTGLLGLNAVLRDLAANTDMLCRTLPDALRRLEVDAIVADQTEAAGGLVARHLGLPYVSVANALPIDGEDRVPPAFTGWGYDPSFYGRWRNRGGYRVARLVMGHMRAVIRRHAAAWGLGDLRELQDCLSADQVVQLVPALDYPRAGVSPRFRYVGPLRDADGDAAPVPPGSRPRAYVTFGTLQGNRPRLFATLVQGCVAAGLDCLVTHGGRLGPTDATAIEAIAPGRVVVRAFVPQRDVLRHAALAVTHGGLNTVLDALSFGVPVLCVPLAFEQAGIAARVRHAGAGIVLGAAGLRPRTVAQAAAELRGGAYRAAADRIASAIAQAGGRQAAADVVERACLPAARRDPGARFAGSVLLPQHASEV